MSTRSSTRLRNGREIYIAGEHEDWYDPDFYIYNDVIVIHPNLEIQIYGYPRTVFRATDFHSATLVQDESIYTPPCKARRWRPSRAGCGSRVVVSWRRIEVTSF